MHLLSEDAQDSITLVFHNEPFNNSHFVMLSEAEASSYYKRS